MMNENTETARLKPECISCLVKKQIENYPTDVIYSEKIKYMQTILKIISEADTSMSAPEIMDRIYEVQRMMFGMEQNYTETKQYFNNLMLGIEKKLMDEIAKSDVPIKTAVKYVMTGNYIDFGAMDKVDENKLHDLLDSTKDIEINDTEFQALKNDLITAKRVVYLTDNCGEIVLDKLLISVIKELNPLMEIIAIVRGGNVLNDATLDDARQIGLTDIVKVIGNGNTIAGTCLDKITEEALQAIENADVIISKGQGNFETLYTCGKNIYYIFMCKCKMFSDRFNVPLYTGMLLSDKTVCRSN